MMFPKQKPIRSKSYLAWVRKQPSVISGRCPCDAHHIIAHGAGGMGTKPPDLFTFPLTRDEHAGIHHDTQEWERRHGQQWRFVALTIERAVLAGVVVLP